MIEQILPGFITILAGSGVWMYLSARFKQKEAEREAFNNHLLQEISELKARVDILLKEKEELLQEISHLRSELAKTTAELHSVTTAIRLRNT
jgi:regulator of replication initiation timing